MEKSKAEFDPSVSPKNPQNIQAAKDHKLRYYPNSEVYRDEDGAVVRDKYGQPL